MKISIRLFTIGLLLFKTFAQNLLNLHELNLHLIKNPNQTVGFLSEGNYNSVRHEIHSSAKPKYFDTYIELFEAVYREEVIAGLISGTILEEDTFNTFGSEQITVHSFMFAPNDSLVDVFDNVIIDIIEKGKVKDIEFKNYPFKNLVVHTCLPTPVPMDWHNLKNNSVIKIGALGPYNWGQFDGDYTVTPYTGFWPDYLDAIEQEFKDRYQITFERVWYPTSSSLLDAVLNGDVNTTEPYMLVGSAYKDRSRKSQFETSCVTGGSQSKWFTKKHVEKLDDTIEIISPNVKAGFYMIIGMITLLLILAVFAIGVLFKYERKGKPIFEPLVKISHKPSAIMNNVSV